MPPKPAATTDRDRERLESLLDALPDAPDISALDGFLVGVLLQPQKVPEARWLPFVHDFDGGRAGRGDSRCDGRKWQCARRAHQGTA